MTNKNKEKAREIAEETGYFGERNGDFVERYQACIKMAAWKDKQFSDRVEMTLCIDCHEFESCNNCSKYKLKKELLGT